MNWKLSLLFTIGLLVLITGCGGDDPTDPGNPGGGDEVTPAPILSEAQFVVLTNAQDLYDRLAGEKSDIEARAALVESLTTWNSISDVHLWEDGITVSMMFPDSLFGIVETGDSNSFSGGGVAAVTTDRPVAHVLNAAKAGGVIPDSTSVVFQVLAVDVPAISEHVIEARRIFVDNGWDPLRVIIREPVSMWDVVTVNPNTLFEEIQQYGIIFLYTHGKYGRPLRTLLSQQYTLFCYNYNYPNFDVEQIKVWARQGKVLVSKESLYLRQDVLAEQMSPFPGSIVILNVCWGYYAADSYLTNGASSVFSWDHMVMNVDAYVTNCRLAEQMGSAVPAPSDRDMMDDPLLVQSSPNTLGESANLHLDNSGPDAYFPAFVDFTCNADAVGFAVSGVRVTAESGYAPDQTVLFDASGSGRISGLFPGETDFTVEVLNVVGGTGLTVDVDRDLHAGANEIDVNFQMQEAHVNLLRYTYEDGYFEPVSYTTQYIRWWKWNRNPDGSCYTVIYHHDTDGSPDQAGSKGSTCEPDEVEFEEQIQLTPLRKEQVIEIYGEDLFGMSSDEVVMIKHGSSYAHHDGEDTISEWIERIEAQELAHIAGMWYEVYFE